MFGLQRRRALFAATTPVILASIFSSQQGLAAVDCYTFSNIDTTKEYHVGDSFNFDAHQGQVFALRVLNGEPTNPSDPNAQFLTGGYEPITNSASGSPEMHQYLTTLKITPAVPAKKIWFDYAQNSGFKHAGLLGNVGSNGDELQLRYGMAAVNGLVLGNNNRGQVEVTSDMTLPPESPAQWVTGHIEFTAISGAIDYVAFGGLQAKFDDVCIETP